MMKKNTKNPNRDIIFLLENLLFLCNKIYGLFMKNIQINNPVPLKGFLYNWDVTLKYVPIGRHSCQGYQKVGDKDSQVQPHTNYAKA